MDQDSSCHAPGVPREPRYDGNFTHNTGKVHGLSAFDHAFFALILVISTAIGIFQAFRSRFHMDLDEYILAGREMGYVPVGLSLMGTFVSGIAMLGAPAEIYKHNTMYTWIGLSFVFVGAASAHVYIPVYYQLGITTAYQVRAISVFLMVPELNFYLTMITGNRLMHKHYIS